MFVKRPPTTNAFASGHDRLHTCNIRTERGEMNNMGGLVFLKELPCLLWIPEMLFSRTRRFVWTMLT